MIHGHGNNLHLYGDSIQIDFSSNIAFNNQATVIMAHLEKHLDVVKTYPDPHVTQLTKKIATHHNLSPHNVLVTNGSAEAFYLIAHFFSGARSGICIPAFAEYEDACTLYNHSLDFIPLEELPSLRDTSYGSIWLGNPNNPNGYITPPQSIINLCQKFPTTFFVVDQAYTQLTSQSDIDLLRMATPDNLIVIHSLTKEFAIPGLRLGYIIAAEHVISQLTHRRPPWNVNALAMVAGECIMDNYAALLPDKKNLMAESLYLQDVFSRIGGIEVIPSSCNFFLSRLTHGTAATVKQRLIDDYGILIRDASNFRGLDERYFRVAAQTRASNTVLKNALSAILHKGC